MTENEGIYLGSKDQVTEIGDTDTFIIATNDGIRRITKAQVMEKLGINQLTKELENAEKPTDEQVTSAVNAYLQENPVAGGATAEQIEQIEKNKKDIGHLQEEITNMETGVDETAVQKIIDEHMENNSQAIATLTINGQQYNGSEDVVVVIEAGSGSGGGSSEMASEEQLATGYIDAETYPTANVSVETGLTLADLKKYKRFLIREKGASNTALANFRFKLGSNNIFRNSLAGGYAFYEWLDDDRTLLKITDFFFGASSGVPSIGSSAIARTFAWPVNNISSTYNSILGLFDFSEFEDDTAIYLSSATVPTIIYNWEIRGLTV